MVEAGAWQIEVGKATLSQKQLKGASYKLPCSHFSPFFLQSRVMFVCDVYYFKSLFEHFNISLNFMLYFSSTEV